MVGRQRIFEKDRLGNHTNIQILYLITKSKARFALIPANQIQKHIYTARIRVQHKNVRTNTRVAVAI